MTPFVLAHAGHWVEGIAFGSPVVAVPAILTVLVARERRRERRQGHRAERQASGRMRRMPTTPRLWTFKQSPFAGKVRAAFAEKGVEVELAEIHPVKRAARFLALSAPGRVPVLELGDGQPAIRESAIICEWLEETHPEPPLWPADSAQRGWARGWAKWVDDFLVANFFLGMRKLALGTSENDPDDVVERLHRQLAKHWPALEAALGEHPGPWLCGAQLTYADLSGLPLAVRLPEWGPHLVPAAEDYPRITVWLEALRERPSAATIDQGAERILD